MARIVVKLGTQVVTDEADTGLAEERLGEIMRQMVELSHEGNELLLVSSGAVGLGRKTLSLPLALTLIQKQSCAAVGQSLLMHFYEAFFGEHRIKVAQILVTAHDFADRTRYLNLRNCFEQLLALRVIPIINENDVVSTAGITEAGQAKSFDDNDKLSALVAGKLEADLLVILSNVEGVFADNPLTNPEAKLIRTVDSLKTLGEIRTKGQSALGRGGMSSKLAAAKIATLCGVKTVICTGMRPGTLALAVKGEIGTDILPVAGLSSRERWIGFASGYSGTVIINDCTRSAFQKGEKISLLPIGVTAVRGDFEAKAIVSIQDSSGRELGRGLSSMSSKTLLRVLGMHTEKAKPLLQAGEKDEVVHRDSLVLFETEEEHG